MTLEKFDWKGDPRLIEADIANFRTLVTEMEGGRTQSRHKAPLPRRWLIRYEKNNIMGPDATAATDIRKFFERHKGRYKPFLIDIKKDDGTVEEDVEVRFDVDTLSRREEYDVLYRFGLPIVETSPPNYDEEEE